MHAQGAEAKTGGIKKEPRWKLARTRITASCRGHVRQRQPTRIRLSARRRLSGAQFPILRSGRATLPVEDGNGPNQKRGISDLGKPRISANLIRNKKRYDRSEGRISVPRLFFFVGEKLRMILKMVRSGRVSWRVRRHEGTSF